MPAVSRVYRYPRHALYVRICHWINVAAVTLLLASGLQMEGELFITAFSSEDRQEGVRAFLEKRQPDLTGR